MDIEEFLLPKRLQGLGFRQVKRGKLDRGIDKLLAPLWKARIYTTESCSGHGTRRGYIEVSKRLGRDLTEKQVNRITGILEKAGAKNVTVDTSTGMVGFDSTVKAK